MTGKGKRKLACRALAVEDTSTGAEEQGFEPLNGRHVTEEGGLEGRSPVTLSSAHCSIQTALAEEGKTHIVVS